VVTRQLQVERGTGKVRQSKTGVLTTVQRNQLNTVGQMQCDVRVQKWAVNELLPKI